MKKAERFIPTENELLEYYESKNLPFPMYRTWLHSQLNDVLRFAFAFDMNLLPLRPYSKTPPINYPYDPLTYNQAYSHLRGNNENQTYFGNFGIRGAGQDSVPSYVLIDYDQKELTPALEKLVRRNLSIMTPNGWAFITREPVDIPLWTKMEAIPGFTPSEAALKARKDYGQKDLETLSAENGFTDSEREYFGASRFILGNARRNRSYVCLPGAVTCTYQTSATGLPKPIDEKTGKPVQHWGFGHTGPTEPCNGSPNGKHDYRMRFFYKKDGDYTTFTPRSATILPFKYFAEQVLKE